MRPDDCFCASQQEQERVIRQERVRFSCEETLCWTQTLSPGHLRRLDDWMRAHVALHGPCSGSICDIDHNVCMQGRSCAPGALLPPLFTHGTYWSTRWNRPLTGSEHMVAQGIGAGCTSITFICALSANGTLKLWLVTGCMFMSSVCSYPTSSRMSALIKQLC